MLKRKGLYMKNLTLLKIKNNIEKFKEKLEENFNDKDINFIRRPKSSFFLSPILYKTCDILTTFRIKGFN